MSSNVEYFGIRHHGPGSARRLVEALDAIRPAELLIEGPVDLSDLIPMLANHDMVPPVALLAYPAGEPERSIFWPFAVFSPEYQAILWAVKHGVPARFIDLPVAWRWAETRNASTVPKAEDEPNTEGELTNGKKTEKTNELQSQPTPIQHDPIGALAAAAGYQDGESWWQHVIEENPDPGPIFAAVADAMRALREDPALSREDDCAREAHMRLEIAKSRKQTVGTIAVVCGAWHVPALQEKHTAKDDRELVKGSAKRKFSATWTPWTAPRLALASGYSAGVAYPGWNQHLWETPRRDQTTRWLARTARCLREHGHDVSTASLIEAEKLAVSLAAIRGRPQAGFEELVDATVASICFGNEKLWETVAAELLIGRNVGSIPDGVPLAPLLEDLQRQQKEARLKPESLERELMVDLRSESGLFRSTLLHRLAVLGVSWGKLDEPGRSRGTFRERWVLKWEPEHAVALVENLIYGATIAQAAAGRIVSTLHQAKGLGELSNLVFAALTAQLPDAAATVSEALEHRAGQATDCSEMLSALPPIADVLRYGKARDVDTGQMSTLFDRIAMQAAIALHHAARGLDEKAASLMRDLIREADRSIQLIESSTREAWLQALRDIIEDEHSTALVAGQATRLLYEGEQLDSAAAVDLMARRLSPGTTTSSAAGFFEGFLDGIGERLIHDKPLRNCVSNWVLSLDGEAFIESLPLFRRVFSSLDRMQRQRLMAAVLGQETQHRGYQIIEETDGRWMNHVEKILKILREPAIEG